VQAALAVLEDQPDPEVRPLLLRVYSYFGGEGNRHDSGCYVRSSILRLLRPISRQEDTALLEHATAIYESLPPYTGPTRGDVAMGLRGAALVALSDLDERLAGYHAVRLLVDPRTSPMSGEPAVSAVQVLAAQGQLLPLYGYLLSGDMGIPDVVAECLRQLTPIPATLLGALVERYQQNEDEIVLLGLFDLLLAHQELPAYVNFILDFLRTTRLLNIYRYLVSAIIAGRHKEMIAALETMVAGERSDQRRLLLQEALALR